MTQSCLARRFFFALCFFALLAFADISLASDYQPTLGQEGKDVIWLPTCQALVDTMLDIAKVTPRDYLIDLGSGDGRLVITAAKQGARALGVEYNPDMVALSKRNAVREGVAGKATFIQADIYESDFSEATVITMFLLDEINLKLRPKILNLSPGTRVVSNTFGMGQWKPDQTIVLKDITDCGDYYTAHLWIVPAKVGGTWGLPQGELTLKQSFQTFSGAFRSGSNTISVTEGKLSGGQISFNVGQVHYTGRVSGNVMEGIYKSGGTAARWKANRIGPEESQKESLRRMEVANQDNKRRGEIGGF